MARKWCASYRMQFVWWLASVAGVKEGEIHPRWLRVLHSILCPIIHRMNNFYDPMTGLFTFGRVKISSCFFRYLRPSEPGMWMRIVEGPAGTMTFEVKYNKEEVDDGKTVQDTRPETDAARPGD